MIIIANIIAIFRKELQSYFLSPLSYIFASIFWFSSGLLFISILKSEIQFSMASNAPVDVAYNTLTLFLQWMGILTIFILCILSMGLYAEERKQGTLELLATSPLTNWSVAVGKLLGVVTFFTVMILPLLGYEIAAFSVADPPIRPEVPLLGHLGLILLAASILSLGMFISSLTDSSILAAFLTFVMSLFLLIFDLVAQLFGGFVGEIMEHLSLLRSYSNLFQGILDFSSLVLFASYIILGIFLTAQSIDAFRFNRQ